MIGQDFYHSLEDKWYGFLDSLDEKKIPVYSVIDPIDKVIPSLIVGVGVIALVLLLLFLLLLGGIGGTDVVLTFNDVQERAISGLSVDITIGNETQTKITNSVGKIVLKGVGVGQEITIAVDDPQYQSFSQVEKVVEANQKLVFTLNTRNVVPSSLTFQFVDGGHQSLAGKTLTISVVCTNGSAPEKNTYTITNGILTLTPTEDCPKMVGTISGNGIQTKDGVLFSAENSIITLSTSSTEKGKAKITVRSTEDNAALENMDVELFNEQGVSVQTIATNSFGVAIFSNVPVGEYYASASDAEGNFALTTSETFTLSPNQTTSVDVLMGKQIQGTLSVSVTAKAGNAWISNATVKLIRKSDNKLLASKVTTTAATPLAFDVSEKGPFLLTASHSEYLSETKELSTISGAQNAAFALEKLTAQNSGKIVVNVTDEDGLSVDNAQVMLYDAASGFLYHAANASITDVNGNAKFSGVPSGTYFARATKYPAGPSDSPNFTTDKSLAAQVKLTLTIGQALVQATVKDQDGNPIAFSTVEFITDGTDECTPNKCAVQTDVLGVAQKSFKADRKIYIRARATGYTSFVSASYQLYPAQTRMIEAKLPKTILGELPKVSFVDVRDPVTGNRATDMKTGKTYLALFNVQVPSALTNVQRGGIHVRVGREELLENDILSIVGVNAPAAAVVRGTSYQPDIAFEDGDELHLTNGDAKWANVEWNVFDPGVYEVSFLVRVSEEASNLDELPFFYRAWVENDDDAFLRDPFDATLGTAQTSTLKEGQYAETYQKIYFNGKSIVCDETFCYSGENVLNEDDQLLAEGPPYELSINKKYTYSFVLTSNASTVYQKALLRVLVSEDVPQTSEEALFDAYTVTRPDGQTMQGSGLSTSEIPGGGEGKGLDMGKLEQFKTIVGEFSFTPKKVGPTHVVVQLINEGEIVFEQLLPLSISSQKQLNMSVDPTTAAAFISTTFDVRVRDSEGFEIQDALVSLLKIDPNQIQQFVTKQYTDVAGRTTLIAPPSLPNTRFVIDAVKGGYASEPVQIIVDENIAVFTPEKLTFTLPNAPNTEQFLPLDITNQTQANVIISHVEITGDFQGLLSNGEMQNYVEQYENVTTIGSLETKTIQVKASTSASVSLASNKLLNGSFMLTFRNTETNQEWVQAIPFSVNVKVVGACDDEAIQLSGTPASGTLSTTAFDNKSQTPFQITNICHVDGKPYPLKNLKAKVVWKSNPIGHVELSTTDIEGSAQALEVLRSGAYTTLFDTFKTAEESTYESILTFTPFPQNIGQTADFTVYIAGEIGSGNAIMTVDESFDVKIKVTNLETCMTFDPEPEGEILLRDDEEYVEFEVDSSACGSVPVDVFFCTGTNNSNCSGGSPEGRLFLSQYSINNLSGSKTIRINRQGGTLPGSYDLTVDASVPGVSPYRIAALNVKVESDSSYAFEMEKSNFSVYQQNAKDATSVINRLLLEKVRVTASICDWEEASKRPMLQKLGISGLAGSAAYYVGAKAAAGGFLGLGGAVITPWTLAIAVAVAVFLTLFEDECDSNVTHAVTDYVINLSGAIDQEKIPKDAIDIKLSSNVKGIIHGEWVADSSTIFKDGEKTIQQVGAVFTNLDGYSNPNPLFAVATLRATEHTHGDLAHGGDAHVTCGNGEFGTFNVGASPSEGSCDPAQNTVREEKFHVKFRTQDSNQSLPKLNFDSVACVSGTTLGSTGAGSIPNVAFNWAWSDSTGIPLYACDASNPTAIYCDATQFNIDLMKRLHALDGFLAANDYTFTCPDNPALQPDHATFDNSNTIPSGFVGLVESGYDFQAPTSIQFTGKLYNNSLANQTLTFTVNMVPNIPEGSGSSISSVTCSSSTDVLPASTADVSCTIHNLSEVDYTTQWSVGSTTTTNIAYATVSINLDVASYGETGSGTCESLLKTTAIINGAPEINRWIDVNDPVFGSNVNDDSVVYTAEVPNVHVLEDLMHFDAYLIRDGYSKDFENDFRDFYSSQSFADAPAWFTGGNGLPGLNAFYGDDDALVFSNKYFDDTALPSAGKYRVDISVFFGDDWRLTDGQGSTSATIGVDFYHVKSPSPNSPFYSLPFDGLVGLNGTEYDRVGYGVEFINESTPIKVNDSLVQTYSGEGSSAMEQVTVEYEDDLRTLNSIPSTRGNILEISTASSTSPARVVFSPSLATPTVMKITQSATTQPFSTFYNLAQNGTPVDTGSALTFWEGAGNCYDYTSVPVYEKFNFTPDRAANNTDKLSSWSYSYALDWPFARVSGNEYLRTIFYTPAQGSYSIISQSETTKFFTSNYASASTSQTLDGINTLAYNNASTVMDSMQDVFDLVSDGKICVSDSGSKARFFWNPETLYKQTSQTSVSAFTNGLVAGNTCLGAPAN